MTRLSLVLCVLMCSLPLHAKSILYAVTPADSLLYVRIYKDRSTPLAHLAHDHVVRASLWQGWVTVDPDDLSSCSIDISLDVAGLVVDEPEMRRHVGLEQILDAKTRAQIDGNMREVGQLNPGAFKQMHFVGRHCVAPGAGQAHMEVTAQVRGQSKNVDARVHFTMDDAQLSAQGAFEATHHDFGFEPYSAMLGALKNSEPLYFFFDIRAVAQP